MHILSLVLLILEDPSHEPARLIRSFSSSALHSLGSPLSEATAITQGPASPTEQAKEREDGDPRRNNYMVNARTCCNNMAADDGVGSPAFKRAQKRYRRRTGDPDRVDDLDDADMLDFHFPDDRMIKIDSTMSSGVIGKYQGPLFGLKAFPGFFYAPSALSEDLQLALARRAVSEYCEKPHATNIDAVPPKADSEVVIEDTTMWDLWKREHGFVEERASSTHNRNNQQIIGSSYRSYRSFRKLSWSTCGYHYDWTARAYHEAAQSPVPPALAKIGKIFAETALQFDDGALPEQPTTASPSRWNFEATACIVNYYDSKSAMGGHRDDLEEAVTKPVVSFSLGRPAIFLLGGATLDAEPVVPILVRPGDVMILGGATRLNYHSMARVLPCKLPERKVVRCIAETAGREVGLDSIFRDDSVRYMSKLELEALSNFLSQHRININLRQVYND